METSKLIYTKIPKIMSLVGVVGKDRKNTQQNYNFRGIDDMYNALNEHLSAENVFATSKVVDLKREDRPSKSGGTLLYSIVTMEFEFFAEDGSSVKSVTVGEAMDSGDKSMNKAMSTAYKYALMQIFCIPTEEEKDTEYQSHEVARTQPKATPIDTNEFSNSTCKDCGGSINISMAGKPYCANKCWLPEGKHFRDAYQQSKEPEIVVDDYPLPPDVH